MEPHFILEYKTFSENGYNMTPGGDGKRLGSKESDMTRKKKSLSHMGKKHTPEHIRNNVESRKGYKHSDATLHKLRIARVGKEPVNKGVKTPRCSCIICKKEIDIGNLGRHHRHLPNTQLLISQTTEVT
jgi:hypothetical protein